MSIMRDRLRAMAAETLSIVETGRLGDTDLSAEIEYAVRGTRYYPPDEPVPTPSAVSGRPVVEITGESTLAAAARLTDPLALNFASATKPGGGFINGAQAQEESLARSSALYPSLLAADEFYAYHRAHRNPLYSDRMIYSPGVPVFRGDRGELLASAYAVSFLTVAAPNRAAAERDRPHLLPQVPGVLAQRAARILRIAAAHGHTEIVLGAWGCGVFGNDPDEVAGVFAAALREAPWFERVVFAILDRRENVRDVFRAHFR
jgi:uncharacterized protein (TIGR02452 family)